MALMVAVALLDSVESARSSEEGSLSYWASETSSITTAFKVKKSQDGRLYFCHADTANDEQPMEATFGITGYLVEYQFPRRR